jgi:hypothetical protein
MAFAIIEEKKTMCLEFQKHLISQFLLTNIGSIHIQYKSHQKYKRK